MDREQSDMEKRWFIPDWEERELWFSSVAADDSHAYDADKAYAHFLNRTRKAHMRTFRLRAILYGAAAVFLALLISTVSYWLGGHQVRDCFTDIVVEAPLGAKTRLVLPDSTLVWLNAGSQIVYSQGFGVSDRHIDLVGEAYFEVRTNEDLPFDVATHEMSVTVLGTKFNFRNYADDGEVIVNLLEGRVRLENGVRKMEPRYLSPSEKATLNKATGEMRIARTKVDNAREWTNDKLFFDEMPLADIVKELSRSYNVRIRIMDDRLAGHRFYALFDRREQSIYDVLDILIQTNQLIYKEEGDSILLYAR